MRPGLADCGSGQESKAKGKGLQSLTPAIRGSLTGQGETSQGGSLTDQAGSASLVCGPGEERLAESGFPGMQDPHSTGGAPHLNGAVITSCQEELLFHRAEGH